MNSTQKMDSFKVVKIDTISRKDELIELLIMLSDQTTFDTKLMEIYTDEFKNNMELVRLAEYSNSALRSSYQYDADKSKLKFKALKEKDSLAFDDINHLEKDIEKADSIKPLGYKATCAYQIKSADFSVKRILL